MTINLIVAMGEDRAIGRGGDLIWHLREDLRHFKALTMGHAIVMGRKTWQSLPGGALPGRRNIVVSRNPGFEAPGAEVYPTVPLALKAAARTDPEPFVIGGGTIYAATLSQAAVLHLTEVAASFPDADTHFPPLEPTDWEVVDSSEPKTDPGSGLGYRFKTLRRKCDEGSNHKQK